MKSLVIAEKPSVAREIARVLNCNNKNHGYIEGSKYVVTWALGHLVTLAEPEDYDQKLKQWRMEDLPMLPDKMKLKVIRQTSKQYQVVKKLLHRSDIDELIIATDAGREGELVARWIIVQAKCHKPFKRLWISSQTDSAIQEGFKNLKPGSNYNKLYDAAVCRAEADWVVGLNVTRALSCKHNAQLNAGRVQTPTLAMVVQREREIQEFKPQPYWTVRADFGDYYGDWRDSQGQSRIFDQEKARQIADRVQGQQARIEDIRTERKNEAPPLLYDLTELQRDANRRLNFSAQKTLSVLQRLYEQHKLVTYPRTDSRYLSSDIVPTLKGRLQGIATGPYQAMIEPIVSKPLNPGSRFVDNKKVSDHHAIIPTGEKLKLSELSLEEKGLFDLISRRFIAMFYPPYSYEKTTISTLVNSERFYSRGRVVKAKGWKAVTQLWEEKDTRSKEILPEQSLKLQERGSIKGVKSCNINRAMTSPPPRYTEASILTAMENPGKFIQDKKLRESISGSGLGTPATRAEIIEKLISSFYMERKGKQLVPTSKARQLIELAPESLTSPVLTAQWEEQLNLIARGNSSRKQFMESIKSSARQMIKDIKEDQSEYKPDNVSRKKCPACGKNMLLVQGKKGKMLVCQDRSCGHRQPEKAQEGDIFKKNRQQDRVNQRLLKKYSDDGEFGSNLGEILKAALEEKSRKTQNEKQQ
ncbi:MAG: DNA topoisomerase III [Syntrophomonadaceae bacterium]|jgi:DNA topoisomerase-3|nr:DNA topoisomerase III [Syntrophomonadaceae bacterium]